MIASIDLDNNDNLNDKSDLLNTKKEFFDDTKDGLEGLRLKQILINLLAYKLPDNFLTYLCADNFLDGIFKLDSKLVKDSTLSADKVFTDEELSKNKQYKFLSQLAKIYLIKLLRAICVRIPETHSENYVEFLKRNISDTALLKAGLDPDNPKMTSLQYKKNMLRTTSELSMEINNFFNNKDADGAFHFEPVPMDISEAPIKESKMEI